MTVFHPLGRVATALATLATAGAAFAHPGHDSAPTMGFFEGLAHMLTQPDHVGLLVGVGIVAGVGVRALRTRRQRGQNRRSRP